MGIDKALKVRLQKIDQIRDDLKKAEESATKDIMSLLKNLMAENPKLVALRWHQYTPSFNDGEPCEFSIGELSYKFDDSLTNAETKRSKDDEDEDEDEDEGFMDNYELNGFFESKTDIANHKEITVLKKAVKDANKVFSSLCQMDSQLKDMFGSNMEIVVTKDGVETENYDCGY